MRIKFRAILTGGFFARRLGGGLRPSFMSGFASATLSALALAALWPAGARAGTKAFNVANGDFTADGSWNPAAAPVAGDEAVITNAGTATLSGGTVLNLGTLSVGYGGGNGTMIQTDGAVLSVTNLAVGGPTSARLGAYTLAGGSLTTYGSTFIASNGPALFTVSNGASFTATNLYIGAKADGTALSGAAGTMVYFGGAGAQSTINLRHGEANVVGSSFMVQNATLVVSNAVVTETGYTGRYGLTGASSTTTVQSAKWDFGGRQLRPGAASLVQFDSGSVVTNVGSFYFYAISNSRMVITNGGKLFSGTTPTFGGAVTDSNNVVDVVGDGSTWNVGNTTFYAGGHPVANTGNWLRVSQNGAVINVTTLSLGTKANASNNGVLLTGGGLLELSAGLTVGNAASTGNVVSNSGGILQFTTATPAISLAVGAGNAIIMNNGTLSYRNVFRVNITNNWVNFGIGTNGVVWQGNDNGFRLNNSTGTCSLASAYVFANNLGPTNYARLEMVNGATAFTGKGIQVDGVNGGSLLLADTSAAITGGVELVGPVPVTVVTDSGLTGELSGSGGLVKLGAGALTLNSANSYAGATSVSNGTLRLANDQALSPNTDVTIGSGAKLDVLSGVTVTVRSLTVTNKVLYAGTYTKAVLGAAVFPGDGTLITTAPVPKGTLIRVF